MGSSKVTIAGRHGNVQVVDLNLAGAMVNYRIKEAKASGGR